MQRTTQDIYALAVPNDNESHPGDTVEIQHREDRLRAHGWITGDNELTETGAAIINYYIESLEQGELGSRIEEGAGNFVDDALKASGVAPEVWDVIDIDQHRIKVVNNEGAQREYTAG